MASSSIALDSLLALDIGETTTRAILFDTVDGGYRFVAVGTSPTTLGLPWRNVSEGVRQAIDDLSAISGRVFIGQDERLILPSAGDGSGVDSLVIVISGGPPLKVIVTGLLEDVSVESARHLAETTYSQVVDTFSLNDRRKTEARLDAILHLRPDLILIAGGTEGGAGQSITRMLEPVRLACNLLPPELRPHLLYAGNQELGERIQTVLSGLTQVDIAPNVRPSLENEQLEPAHAHLARAYRRIVANRYAGLQELDGWAGGGLIPRASAFGRVIRFLSLDDAAKGVLGVDVGSSATILAAAQGGDTHLGVFPQFGLS
ncbi:MAG: glutamate mutase L, partial [Anaerolineales bacterium]